MTYKELLFKMARRGMLTLSNDKDGRGLFWAGADRPGLGANARNRGVLARRRP